MNHRLPSRYIIFLIFFLCLLTCEKNPSQPQKPQTPQTKTNSILVDTLATPETIALFTNLQKLHNKGFGFGHQDDLAYGVDWWAVLGESDVKRVCGDYPAVYGWDVGDIGGPTNLDGVSFADMKNWIREAYSRGGINTISMHLDNPVTKGNAWDNSPAVAKILPGGSHHADYLRTLDLIAAFLKDLKTAQGVYIPIILRPYHEHNHTWSWWGAGACTADEYNALWRMTVAHFRDTHQIHHLLYAISPQEITSEADYLARYPGDQWVDILGLDYYNLTTKNNVGPLGRTLEVITKMAEARNKVAALTEVGVEKVPYADWWTGYLLAAIKYSAQSRKIAYALVWRNASKNHFFAPYPGHATMADFLVFYQDPLTLFEKDLPKMYE